MTTFEFFQLAAHVEELARDTYLALAAHQGTPKDLAETLRGLAAEEEEHARRVRLLGDSLAGGGWPDGLTRLLAEKVQGAALAHQHLLWEVRSRRRPGDLEALLARLADMEVRLGFTHAEQLAKVADHRIASFFATLAKQDRRHAALLDAARRAGSDASPEVAQPAGGPPFQSGAPVQNGTVAGARRDGA